MRKTIYTLFLLYFLLFSQTSQAQVCGDKDVIYQYGTIGALMSGNYDGELTLQNLRTHGDFGIGTFNTLDGEMLLVDGEFYQVKGDGKVYQPSLETRSPFAAVTSFEKDMSFNVDSNADYQALQELIKTKIDSNYPYAVRIEGEFGYVKTRSVPAQAKPYPPLTEVSKTQPIFEMKDQQGVLVGYVLPEYLKDLNMVPFHLHYLSADHKNGGHLLDIVSKKVTVYLDQSPQLFLDLPKTKDFAEHKLQTDLRNKIKAAEGGGH